MKPESLLAQITDDADLMVAAAQRAGWDARVPGLEWDVRTVVTHTGAVHRWSADVVRRALPTNETGGSSAFWPDGLPDAELPGWIRDGAHALTTLLGQVTDGLACFTFLPGVPPRRFWIHRQAHETAVHRLDVELAGGGPVTAFAPQFAQDGLTELVGGFATEPGFATSRPGRLLLACTDGPSWLVEFGGERTRTTGDVPADTKADAVVGGDSDALYRWVWNRPSPAAVESGDPGTLASWRAVRIL
ncbi:maleylpyruvate isomerase family mycothiol-dependent enzyme [Nakamurella flava]|nr:maleylpyruvate isomerase family mycothiol-dependent enzyme [Nakamurella flava]